jgi:transcriptional regulator with XRE-family HTH domain
MKLKDTHVDLSPWEPIQEHPTPPGQLLQELRLQAGLSRRELAFAAGITNPSKGVNRVCQWERGERRPETQKLEAMDKALGVKEGGVAALWKPLDRIQGRHWQVRQKVISGDAELLRAHHEFLQAHEEQIVREPHWAHVRVQAARLSLSWAGGGVFTLGELLAGWRDGRLRQETRSGSLARIFGATGSALSGLRQVQTLCGSVFEQKPSSMQILSAFKQPRPPFSGQSLAQLLAELGVAVKDLVVRDHRGQAVARYDHSASILFSLDGRALATRGSIQAGLPMKSSFYDVRIGGRKAALSFGELNAGRWQKSQLELGDDWTYHDGRLVHRDHTALWLDGAPPPALVPVLRRLLAQP